MIRWWNPCGFDMIMSHSPNAISRVSPSMPVGSSSTTSHAKLGKFGVPGCQDLVNMCFPNTLKNLFTHICSEENLGGLRQVREYNLEMQDSQSWKIHSQPRSYPVWKETEQMSCPKTDQQSLVIQVSGIPVIFNTLIFQESVSSMLVFGRCTCTAQTLFYRSVDVLQWDSWWKRPVTACH